MVWGCGSATWLVWIFAFVVVVRGKDDPCEPIAEVGVSDERFDELLLDLLLLSRRLVMRYERVVPVAFDKDAEGFEGFVFRHRVLDNGGSAFSDVFDEEIHNDKNLCA